jgi:hypothetical protein
MKVVATVAFGMGLDKRDVGAVRLITSFIFCINLHDLVSEKRSSLVWYTQKSDSLILNGLLLHGAPFFPVLRFKPL